MKLEVKNISCGYGNKEVINQLSLTVESGEILCLLGPNGSGKTTLFKAVLRLLDVNEGQIFIDGEDIKGWSRQKIARVMGYIPQAHNPPFPFNVLDVVLMGRTAYLGAAASPKKKDVEIAKKALDILNISHFQDRIYTEISGGERQLVLIARALAQEPKILIMDEPTASLDFGNQLMILKHIELLAKRGLALIMASHFPDHALLYSTQALLLKHGEVCSQGKPEEIITEERLKNLYGADIKIVNTRINDNRDIKVCVPAQ